MQEALVVLSLLLATIPMVGFLYVIWWLDRYDREPAPLFVGTFLWGATGGIALAVIGTFAIMLPLAFVLPATWLVPANTICVAPLVEETTKALVLIWIVLKRDFDNTTDGFVYGAAAGLGFAMTENALYFLAAAQAGDPSSWLATVGLRTFYTGLMHAAATSVIGAALGLTKFRDLKSKTLALLAGFTLAFGIHAFWNGLLTFDSLTGGNGVLGLVDLVVFPIEFLCLFTVFQFCLRDERRLIVAELTDEATRGVIPPEHVAILASYVKRQRRSWLPPGVDHHDYVRSATQLAFRRCQARHTEDPTYHEDVERLRGKIGSILSIEAPPISPIA